MAEVNHRARNLLGVVQAVAQQTARLPPGNLRGAPVRDASPVLPPARTCSSRTNGRASRRRTSSRFADFKDLIGTRVLLEGPPMCLSPAAAQGIGMARTSARHQRRQVRALSNSEGRVHITWQVAAAQDPTFTMQWLEEGGPTVAAPSHHGYGQIVIGSMAEAAVDGTAEIDYRESGLSWKLSAPVADALEGGRVASFA